MEILVADLLGGTSTMDNRHNSLCSSTKTERKLVEKNRRNHMKTLYNNLTSLLPNQNAKELPLPDQIDEAINHIKSLRENLEKSKQKKESLTSSKKRSRRCNSSTNCFDDADSASTSKSPQLEIRETGSSLEIVLITGLDQQFLFYEIIRILHAEHLDVVHASSSVSGNSVFHVVHAEMRKLASEFGATKVTERLKTLVNESTSEIELEPRLWDYEIQPDQTWGFQGFL